MSTRIAGPGLKLRIQSGDEVEEYDLRDEAVTIGRGKDNNLVLRDGRASRNHCRIEPAEEGWRLVDLGSQNGTYVNGRRARRHDLAPGDVVQVGATRIELVPKSARAAGPEPRRRTVEIPLDEGADEPLPVETLLHLQAVAAAMNSELNLENLLNLIIDNAIKLTGAERGFMIVIGRNEMEFRVARNFEQKEVGTPEFAISWSIATQVSTSGEAVLCVNAAEDERFGAEESVLSLGLRSVMCVPFKVRTRVLGVLYLDNRLHMGAFCRNDFRILQMLADQSAVALENARLYKELVEQKSQVEDMNRRLHHQVEEQDSRLRAAVAERGAAARADDGLIGDSQAMREVKALIRKVAASDLPVLITGPSGSGKEIVARAIHAGSDRKNRPLVAENCCAIPENLLESELFGYEKGAFSGASGARRGLLETASGGTLFLDEIGDMSPALQTKLLRVLQEGEVRRLGSDRPQKIDVRLITATNRDLGKLIEQGRFREDLLYRIKVVAIEVPPLKARKDDIPLLVEHFLDKHARDHGEAGTRKTIEPEALELLKAYDWPGNVRELENEIRTMTAFAGSSLSRQDVPAHIQEEVDLLVGEESGFHDLGELVESIETREIGKAMRRAGGNKTKAAKLLGISRFALQRKMDKYGLEDATWS